MVSSSPPANPGDVLLIEENPEKDGKQLRITIKGRKLTWSLTKSGQPIPSSNIGSTLKEFSPGSRVTLYAADGAAPISWTAETFNGLDQGISQKPAATSEIQFLQRCILSGSGLATWRILVSADGSRYSLKYDLTVETNFRSPNSNNYLQSFEFTKNSTPALNFRLRLDAGANGNNQHSFNFLSIEVTDAEVYSVVDPDGGGLRYQAEYSLPNNMHLGNGVVLERGNHDKPVVWQSSQYLLDSRCVRMLEAGIDGISTNNILDNWNKNIDAPYAGSLTGNNDFSAIPTLSIIAGPGQILPQWRVSFSLNDKYDFGTVQHYCDSFPNNVGNCSFSSKTQWLMLDCEIKPQALGSPNQPYISSRVSRILILGGWQNSNGKQIQNVVATMTRFRMQDGTPVVLNNVALTTPASGNPSYPWSLALAGVSTGASGAVGSDGSQSVVRAGAFELYLSGVDAPPKPGAPQSKPPFQILCGADYGVTICPPSVAFAQATGPRPQIDLKIQQFLLLDVGPASEDDLTVDQYALPNQRIPMATTGCSIGNIADDTADKPAEIEEQIQINLQREGPLVFRRPVASTDSSGKKTAKVNKTADGDWYFGYTEQSFVGLKQTTRMQLSFAPKATAIASDESVLVLDRVPFTFAEVHFHPLQLSNPNGPTEVAEWESQTNEWKIVQITDQPSWLLLPPQVLGEEVVRDKSYYPVALDSGTAPPMLLGTPTVVTYAPSQTTNFVQVPWNLRRLLTNASVEVSRLDYEMLYGLACSTKVPHMRLTESSTLYGDIRPGLPQNPAGYSIQNGADAGYLDARLYWSCVWREYQSRLGVLVVEDATNATDPESFRDTANTKCQIRLKDDGRTFLPDSTPISTYLGKSEILSDPTNAANFKGGALAGVEDPGIYRAIITNPNATATLEPQSTDGALTAPRFSALGGYGTTMARFDQNKSTLINTIAMGRSVTYSVERIGRIGCFWNRAKHVVVYERSVLPSRQFYLSQKRFGGIPLLRKVEEYVEFLETERLFTNELQTPQAGFLKGFKCGEKKRVPVDSAWGSSVAGQGWKVPLWNPVAADKLPDVYPMPHLFVEVSTPEQTPGSSPSQPQFVTRDCRLVHPQEVVFFTSTVDNTDANTDGWAAVESIDFVKYPMVVADATIYDHGDLGATPLPEFQIPPGWEPVTFTIEPPAAGVHATDGIVKTTTPIAAKLKTVTASRGTTALTKSAGDLINSLLNDGGTTYSAYQDVVKTFSAIQADSESLLNLATAPVLADVDATLKRFNANCKAFQATVPAQAASVKAAVQKSFTGCVDKVKQKISDVAAAVSTNAGSGKLDMLVNAITHPSADPSDVWRVEAGRIHDLILATWTEVDAWTAITPDNQDRLKQLLQGWSAEVEHGIGSYSPFRKIAVALQDFEQSVKAIQKLSNQLTLAANNSQPITQLSVCQAVSDQYDSAVRNLTVGVSELRGTLPGLDLTMIWPGVKITAISAQFKATLQTAAVNNAAQWNSAVTELNNGIADLDTTALGWVAQLPQATFDILQMTATIQGIVTAAQSDLAGLKSQLYALSNAPNILLSELQAKWTAGAQSIVGSLQTASQSAMNSLQGWANDWVQQEVPGVSALLDSVAQKLGSLQVTSQQELQALQNAINPLAGQIQGALDRTQQVLDQNVRQPLMQLYQSAQGVSDGAMQLVRAFGEPPKVPHLDLQPPEIAYVYDYVNKQIPITPVLARANQVGQALNALGVTLPATKLAEALVPPELKNFDLNKILPNFSGLKLDGLFSGIKLPEVAKDDIVVTHGWDTQARRGWLQADVKLPISNHMVVFQADVLAFCLTKSTFQAQCRIENAGTQIRQSTTGSIVGDWSIELGGGDSLITFGSTALNFDESGKLEFHFNPAQVRLADALKAVTALVQSFSDPKSGFTWGITPSGVKCAFALPIPDTAALTSGFTGLTLTTSLELNVLSGFAITLSLGVSSKDRPFNFAIFILGGCGYVEAGVTYHVDTKKWDGPTVELAIGCSASLAIALGPISGGVYAQFAIELHKSSSGFRTGAFFQISGHVSLLGMVSIDIVLRLEATYDGNVMIATGHVSYEIKMFMFSISVQRDVSMKMGSGGQSSELLLPYPPKTELAGLAGPDGEVPGLAAAFAAAAQAGSPDSPALRYVNMLI